VAFNWGLSRVTSNLSQREAEKSYGIADADLTPYVDWSFYGLRKAWNLAKDTVAPWWRQNSKEAYATGLERLARALKNWSVPASCLPPCGSSAADGSSHSRSSRTFSVRRRPARTT